jgi:outer membrane lipopolysaccharide assembly protein LptE/RlpB
LKSILKSVIAVSCVLLVSGCGYQLTGKGTHVPPGISSIAIPTFVNQTLEPGIEIPFTQGFLREFIFDNRVKVLGRSEADAVLEGVIKTFRLQSVSYNRSGLVMEYQTDIIIDLTLKRKGGEVLWRLNNLAEARWYRASFGEVVPSTGGILNEASKDNAVQETGKFMAERVKSRFFYNF